MAKQTKDEALADIIKAMRDVAATLSEIKTLSEINAETECGLKVADVHQALESCIMELCAAIWLGTKGIEDDHG